LKLERAAQVAVFYEPREGHSSRVGRLALKGATILFEYDPRFIETGLELSPIKLRLRRGVIEGEPTILDGLMGVFDDSLPDGWGRLLIDRRAAELGLSAMSLTPLDRLLLVGARAMGALRYEPDTVIDEPSHVRLSELAKEAEAVQLESGDADLERLIAVGGSPKGARPKVLVQIAADGTLRFGARSIADGFTAWLVKFPAKGDPKGSACSEHAYAEMARAAGIDVPRTQLLRPTKRHEGFFAIERFDRRASNRIHMHTLGGLLHLPHGYPALDYKDVLGVTRGLTRDESAVAEMYRRACFNVLAHNRDDHSRNIAFLMNETGEWSLGPAYDLTYSDGPRGEHTTLVCGEGKMPTAEHLVRLAEDLDVRRASDILDEVRDVVSRFSQFADDARVPPRVRDLIAKAIVPPRTRPPTKKAARKKAVKQKAVKKKALRKRR